MTYIVISQASRSTNRISAPVIRSWTAESGAFAALFFSSNETGNTVPCRFGENGEAFWCIQGKVFSTVDGTLANDADVASMAIHDVEKMSHQFWGTFSLVTYDRRRNRSIVLSDPCGQQPLYFHRTDDGDFHIGGEIEDFFRIGRVNRELDMRYLHEYLAYGSGNPSGTGWRGIALLPPGMCLIEDPGNKYALRRFWSPMVRSRTMEGNPIDILSTVVRLLLKDEQSTFLELSGGVESTALAVAVHRSKLHESVVSLTYYDPRRASSNEVSIARAVARRCQLEHKTFPILSTLPFTPTEKIPHVSRPCTELCFLAQFENIVEAGLLVPTVTLLNGHGGDALFLAPPPFGIPIDAAGRLRLIRAVTALRDLAVQHRVPFAVVLAKAIRASTQFFNGTLASPASYAIAILEQDISTPRIYDDVMSRIGLLVQPARRYQIAALGATLDETIVHVGPTYCRPVMPFLSQPVIELALRLKPKDMFSGFSNRLPFRRAAYQASNLSNLWRRDKGDTTHSVLMGIHKYREHIRDVCLDGRCADDKLIDVQRMDRLIKRAALGYASGLPEITRLFATEIFIRSASQSVLGAATGMAGRQPG